MNKRHIIFLYIVVCFLYSGNGWSQNNPPAWVGIPVGATKQGASKNLLAEYAAIIAKYDTKQENWWIKFEADISKADKQRLQKIFYEMNKEQQSKQKVAFVNGPTPLKKTIPSAAQLISWKNANVYGVWIDGSKVKNAMLNNFQNSDFAQVTVSKLYGAAKLHTNYSYQVNLMTTSYYQKYNDKAVKNRGNRMVFR